MVGRPCWAEVDLDALAHNVRLLAGRSAPARLMAVVKANAYGHGAPQVAVAALSAGATELGVARVDEGVALRLAGITAPITVLAHTPLTQFGEVVAHTLVPSVGARREVEALASAAAAAGARQPVALEVDSGMARSGALPGEVAGIQAAIAASPHLHLVSIYTQMAAPDTDPAFTRTQWAGFCDVGDARVSRHVSNSMTAALFKDFGADMVRPGIALYGGQASDEWPDAALQPVMQLKATVGRVHTLPAGETVSYGRTWTAPRDSRIALIPCGYADGIPRLASNRGAVLVRGQRAPIRGRVCMDQFMVDVTDIPGAQAGDEAVIIGTQGSEAITWEEVGAQANTINYEIMCALAARVPRVYLRGGRVVETTTLVG